MDKPNDDYRTLMDRAIDGDAEAARQLPAAAAAFLDAARGPERPSDDARIHRAARALQAMQRAMNTNASPVPPGMSNHEAFELYRAAQELNYSAAMSFTDTEAMPAESLDPTNRGSWAWWAKRILDAADDQ